MLGSLVLRRARSLGCKAYLRGSLPDSIFTKVRVSGAQVCSGRFLSQSAKDPESDPSEVPPLTPEDLSFMEELATSEPTLHRRFQPEIVECTELPTPPDFADTDWDNINSNEVQVEVVKEEQEQNEGDEEVDLDVLHDVPKPQQSGNLPGGDPESLLRIALKDLAEEERVRESLSTDLPGTNSGKIPLDAAVAAWAAAIGSTSVSGPMPLHQLANRSDKIKNLVKLGVDFSLIVQRHGVLERLLLRDWDTELQPQIRFLIDCGIDPENLGTILSYNTPLLWTDKDHIQVRINYLEAKHFTREEIKTILNVSVHWLSHSTKELDSRLGFIQRHFKLEGREVCSLAAKAPRLVTGDWERFVVSIEKVPACGFNELQCRTLLTEFPACYLNPSRFVDAFQFCHDEVGLALPQIVQHGALLRQRTRLMKPRYEFLKFLNRNIFDPKHPLYISPDWLHQGSKEEFCAKAAKSTVEEYETFLKYSTVM